MIELKPYRSIEISKDLKKEGKQRIAGRIKTSREAYDEGWPYSCLGTLSRVVFAPLLALIMIGIGLELAGFFLSLNPQDHSNISTLIGCLSICLVPLVVLGLLAGWIALWSFLDNRLKGLWRRRSSQYVMQPTMLVSYDRVPRGGEFEIVFRQPIPHGYEMDFSRMEILSVETVTYISRFVKGTEGYPDLIELDTDQHETLLKADEIFDGVIPEDRVYEHRFTYTLPRDIMHSFTLENNSLTWLIRMTIEYRGFTPLTEIYAFQVTPEVHTL